MASGSSGLSKIKEARSRGLSSASRRSPQRGFSQSSAQRRENAQFAANSPF